MLFSLENFSTMAIIIMPVYLHPGINISEVEQNHLPLLNDKNTESKANVL